MRKTETAPGVLTAPIRSYVKVKDVMILMGCAKSKASTYIKDINDVAKKNGKMALPAGRANKYLFSKMTDMPIEDINAVLVANDKKE